MMNNSLGRILFLLKGDWMINRKQHGLVAVIFLIVIWFIELVPLAFSRSFTEWEKAISSMDPSFIHFTIARVLYLFVFLSWVSNTLYHSRIQHFYLVPLSPLEKYILILLQGVVMFILAAVVAIVSLIPYLVVFSPDIPTALTHINPFLGEDINTTLDSWQHVLFISLVSVLIVRPEKRKVQSCRTKSTELTSRNNKTKSTKEGQKTRHLLFYILVNRWLSSI